MSCKRGELIEQVKRYPALYNSKYKRTNKEEIWDKIGREMCEDGDSLRIKWKNIRDGYIKHLKWLTEGGHDSGRYKKWQWAAQMEFYKPFTKYYTPPKYYKQEPAFFDDNKEVESNESTDVTDEVISRLFSEAVQESSEQSKRRRIEEPKNDQFDLDKRPSKTSSHDSVDLLFLGLAKSVKTFSPMRQAITKLEIANFVLEQEVQQREENENASLNKVRPAGSASSSSHPV